MYIQCQEMLTIVTTFTRMEDMCNRNSGSRAAALRRSATTSQMCLIVWFRSHFYELWLYLLVYFSVTEVLEYTSVIIDIIPIVFSLNSHWSQWCVSLLKRGSFCIVYVPRKGSLRPHKLDSESGSCYYMTRALRKHVRPGSTCLGRWPSMCFQIELTSGTRKVRLVRNGGVSDPK